MPRFTKSIKIRGYVLKVFLSCRFKRGNHRIQDRGQFGEKHRLLGRHRVLWGNRGARDGCGSLDPGVFLPRWRGDRRAPKPIGGRRYRRTGRSQAACTNPLLPGNPYHRHPSPVPEDLSGRSPAGNWFDVIIGCLNHLWSTNPLASLLSRLIPSSSIQGGGSLRFAA